MRHEGLSKKVLFLPSISLFLVCFFLTSSFVYAQSPTEASMRVSPEHPTPGQVVSVRLQAHSLDSDTALVTWRVNGEVVERAYSNMSTEFTVGKVGTKYTVSVSAEDGKGKRVYNEKTVTVNDITILWEGRTYTPAFYKGRALHSQGSAVAIQVLPSIVNVHTGDLYDADDLSYLWTFHRANTPQQRGKGLHSIVVVNDRPYTPLQAHVAIKDPTGEVRFSRSFDVPITQSLLQFYEVSPVVGVRYDKAVGDTLGVYGGEMSLISEPYHMSTETRDDNTLDYDWTVGENTYDAQGSLTLNPEGTGSGSALLSVVLKNRNYWLQSARKDVRIEFGKRNEWGIESSNTEAL